MSLKVIKFILQVFFIVFFLSFFIFNGQTFVDLAVYKSRNLIMVLKEELTRPPNIFFWKEDRAKKILQTPLLPVPQEAENINILELPKFGIKAPILTVERQNLNLIYQKLREGVVLFPGSQVPGEGLSIIIGHSSQYPWEPGKYKSVFSLLNELEKNDLIYVFWEKKPLIFQVEEKRTFIPWPKGTETTETLFSLTAEPTLILQSCWPVGVAHKRIAVKTVLVSTPK